MKFRVASLYEIEAWNAKDAEEIWIKDGPKCAGRVVQIYQSKPIPVWHDSRRDDDQDDDGSDQAINDKCWHTFELALALGVDRALQAISEMTGFDEGELFTDPAHVHRYFKVREQESIVGMWAITDQFLLDEMASLVVEQMAHIDVPRGAVAWIWDDADRNAGRWIFDENDPELQHQPSIRVERLAQA